MKDYPVIHRTEYDEERAKLVNRLTQGIVLNFVNSEGEVDWDKLLRYNSGMGRPMQLIKIKSNAGTGILTTEEDVSTEEDLEDEVRGMINPFLKAAGHCPAAFLSSYGTMEPGESQWQLQSRKSRGL